MKFPGGMNIQNMMQQAQKMQEKMAEEMNSLVVDATAGGGAVTVQARGNHEVISVKLSDELVKEGDAEMIGDLVVAALNEAKRKIEESLKGKFSGMLPPGML